MGITEHNEKKLFTLWKLKKDKRKIMEQKAYLK